jgi:hypothetical protein
MLVGAWFVIGRGMVGARFQLLYLPAAWITASVGLWHMRRSRPRRLVWLGVLWAAHLAMSFSWYGWSDRSLHPSWATSAAPAVMAVITAFAAVTASKGRTNWNVVVALLSAMLLGTWFTHGVWRWGPAGRFEPMVERRLRIGPTLLERIDAWRQGKADYPERFDRSLPLSLTIYYLEKADAGDRDAARAVHFARSEIARDDRDPRAWFYLGYAYERQGNRTEQAWAAYQRSYELRPEPIVADAIERLTE